MSPVKRTVPTEVVNLIKDEPKTCPALKSSTENPPAGGPNSKLICVLGAAGGGRDKWKRPEFGRIASEYCDEIILTNEDPYEENPEVIIEEVKEGARTTGQTIRTILDRKEAIKKAISLAQDGDTVIITGKGSETSMAVAGNRKIPWSDKKIVQESLGIK